MLVKMDPEQVSENLWNCCEHFGQWNLEENYGNKAKWKTCMNQEQNRMDGQFHQKLPQVSTDELHKDLQNENCELGLLGLPCKDL